MNEERKDLMLDLLCKKAVYGLDAGEEKQLADLQRESGGKEESLSFELTAAAIGVASVDAHEEMPAALRERIIADADKYVGVSDASDVPISVRGSGEPVRGSLFNWLGWAFAAAACIALSLNIFYTRQKTDIVNLTPAQMREQLIASGQPLARANWGPGQMSDVRPSGDVVWSDATQTGYIRVSGLPKNDPAKETYQLWIVAENQDPKTPVDGGTFDIATDGEVVIPINAKVKAMNPQGFAITIEKPGGVPVSKGEKVPAQAKRET